MTLQALIERWKKDRDCWPPFSDGGQCARKAIQKCIDDAEALIAARQHGQQG